MTEDAATTQGLTSVDEMRGDDLRDTHLLHAMLEEATSFINGFAWCGAVRRRWFGLGVGGVVAVFLFEIDAARPGVDERLWVVVGDLPPAYLVLDDAPTAHDALEGYVQEMSRWAEAARSGAPVDDLIPVNVAPSRENAELLLRRLSFLREHYLSSDR
jgi:hypothetical protein